MKSIRSYSFFFLVAMLFLTACDSANEVELIPILKTTEVAAIRPTTAISGGIITSDAGSSVTNRGVCWSTKARPTIADSKTMDGAGIGSFTSYITGLKESTTYYARAYATTAEGTSYGNEYQFSTLIATPTVTDADGNVYQTIVIGTQVWMVENLKTTKYRDGTAIPNVTDNTAWDALSTPAYCWYNNDATYKNNYGGLYNWYAVNTGKLAPIGWHIPTVAEWKTLLNYVSVNPGISGSLLKALAATTNWETDYFFGSIGNDISNNNNSGFAAMPGGQRTDESSRFVSIGNSGYWWSSTETKTNQANFLEIFSEGESGIYIGDYLKTLGFSIRCIKD